MITSWGRVNVYLNVLQFDNNQPLINRSIMHNKHLLTLLMVLLFINVYSQTNNEKPQAVDYLSVQTGLLLDRYYSMGVRTFFEYQKDVKKNWQFGISYENTQHNGIYVTDQLDEIESNLSLLSLNGYYKMNLIRNRLFWTVGFGFGAVHLNWDDNNRFGVAVNTSLTLNVRVTKRIYIETSPLFLLFPANRVYFSTMSVLNYTDFSAYTLCPIGIKVKL